MQFVLVSLFSIMLAYSPVTIYQPAPEEYQDQQGPLKWHTGLNEANAESKATHKPIFAFFTGSDWCGWCRKLQNDVFSKPAFIEWAKKNVVLLELDFPRKKPMPDALKQQNMGLQQALKVIGYPTVWLLTVEKDETTKNINLNTFGSCGYPQGAVPGKEEVKFLEDVNLILKDARAKGIWP